MDLSRWSLWAEAVLRSKFYLFEASYEEHTILQMNFRQFAVILEYFDHIFISPFRYSESGFLQFPESHDPYATSVIASVAANNILPIEPTIHSNESVSREHECQAVPLFQHAHRI